MGESSENYEESLLWTLEEISRLISQSGDPAETLTNVVQLIQQRFKTDVCSVYLLEPDRNNLVLAATIGLDLESVGKIRMTLNEGLVGLVGEQVQPQVIENVEEHPRYKYFSEAGEDSFHSFLGVPVIHHGLLEGVLVVQTIEPRKFRDDEVKLFLAAGMQLAPVVSEARTLGLGTTTLQACSESWIRCCGASSALTQSLCLNRSRSRSWKNELRNWRCIAGSTMPIEE